MDSGWRTGNIRSVGVGQARRAVAVASTPGVEAIVLLTVMAGLDVLVEIGAVTISIAAIYICRQTTYFKTAPSSTCSAVSPRNSDADKRSIIQFCLKMPKLVASPVLPSPACCQ